VAKQAFTISVNHDSGFMKLLFYAKCWITNKTDRMLQYTVTCCFVTVVVYQVDTFRGMDLVYLLIIHMKMK